MKIHIITALYRVHLAQTLIHYLEPMGIEWYPVVAPKEDIPFDKEWIHPIHVNELLHNEFPYRKINDFLDTQEVIDDDYYGFMSDDNMYEPGFFDVIRQQTAKILFYSVYRGDSTPRNDGSEPHPSTPIRIQSLNDIRICNVGFGMCILKGEILRQTKFKNTHKWDDGRYMERLKLKFPNEIQILPDLWVFGNYFQVGRYTDTTKFLKSNWLLPEYF